MGFIGFRVYGFRVKRAGRIYADGIFKKLMETKGFRVQGSGFRLRIQLECQATSSFSCICQLALPLLGMRV